MVGGGQKQTKEGKKIKIIIAGGRDEVHKAIPFVKM